MKNCGGLDGELASLAVEAVRSCGATRWQWIRPTDLEVRAAFRISCEMNQCGRYGACWSCPPALPDVAALARELRGFQAGLVFQMDAPLGDDFDYSTMEAGALEFYALCRCIEQQLAAIHVASLVLGAGSCRECRRCTYPDAPCIRPQGPVYSLEAYGVDVTALCERADLPYQIQDGRIPYTGLLLLRDATADTLHLGQGGSLSE